MSLEELPVELVLEIFERENLDEIRSLCSTNKTFRNYCNEFARKQIKNIGTDFYGLYVRLSQFHVVIHTYEGETKFAKCHKDNIVQTVKQLLQKMNVQHTRGDISYKFNNERQPDNVVISFENYDDIEKNVIVYITGPVLHRSHGMQIVDQISDLWESLDV